MRSVLFAPERRTLVAAALAVPCLLAVVPIVATLHSSREVNASIAFVDRSNEVKNHLDALLMRLLDAETAVRGFALTADRNYLWPYRDGCSTIPGEVEQIRQLTAESPEQQAFVDELQKLTEVRIQRFNAVVEQVQLKGTSVVPELYASGTGLATSEALKRIITSMRYEEDQRLRQRHARLVSWGERRTQLMIVLSVFNAVFAALVYFGARRLWRMSGFVRMCAWSKTIEYHGEWLSFEDYLRRRFGITTSHGISPKEAEKLGFIERSGAGGAASPGSGA